MSLKEKKRWKILWKMNVPRVVKNFMCKALNNCLPTRMNMFRRRVVKTPVVPFVRERKKRFVMLSRAIQLSQMFGQRSVVLYRIGLLVKMIWALYGRKW